MRNDMELGLDNDKSGKFRELKGREAQMDTFLEDFEQARAQRDAQIATLGARVVHQLQLISLNCRHAELASGTMMSGLDESVLALGNNSAASATELQDRKCANRTHDGNFDTSQKKFQPENRRPRKRKIHIKTFFNLGGFLDFVFHQGLKFYMELESL